MRAPAGIAREGGSFRDPTSGVVLAGSRVLRYFDESGARAFRALVACDVLDDLAARGRVTSGRALYVAART